MLLMTHRNSATEAMLADIPLVDEIAAAAEFERNDGETDEEVEQEQKASMGLSNIIPLRIRPRPDHPVTQQGIVRVDRGLWYELVRYALRLPDAYRAWGAMDNPTGGFVDVYVESPRIPPVKEEGMVAQVVPIYNRTQDLETGNVEWSLDHIEFR
jgi:hypothetical protein